MVDLRGRGTLARGSHADVTIFDPKKRWTFDAAKSRSKSHNTPFDGWQLTGKVVATIVGGKIVYRGRLDCRSRSPALCTRAAEVQSLALGTIPIRFPTLFNTSSACCSSSFVCVAVMIVRMRALPSGTVGKAMPVPSTPSLNSSREKSMVSLPSPMMMG